MDKKMLTAMRRELLRREIERQGLAHLARLCGKPDRQINDMAAGRKSFGSTIAQEIGPKIRPDLPRDWLVFAEIPIDAYEHSVCNAAGYVAENVQPLTISAAKSPRQRLVDRLMSLVDLIDDGGLENLIGRAELLAEQQPMLRKNAR